MRQSAGLRLLLFAALAALSACGASAPGQTTLRATVPPSTPTTIAETAQQLADSVMHHNVRGTETAASFVVTDLAKLEAAQPAQADALSPIADQHDEVLVVQMTGDFTANHSRPPNEKPGKTVLVQVFFDTTTGRTLSIQYFDAPPASPSSSADPAAAATRAADYAALDRLGAPQALQLSGP
jgi:hypothetical protein